MVLGVATTAAYLIGANRSFTYDAAATFANFVATPSLWDAFAVRTVLPTVPIQYVATNDHVLISFISHLIYSLTGSRSEVVYRLIPALAAGGTVSLTTTVLARRFGMIAGVCAGLYIATDPLFVDNSRDLRGYSLAALGAVLATILLAGSWTRWRLVAYSLVMGLAVAAQLFAVVVLLTHVGWIVTRRSRRDVYRLVPYWLGAAVLGGAANAGIQLTELVTHGLPPSLFRPDFPRDTVLSLIGAPVLLPVGLWLAAAALGFWPLRREPWLWSTLVVVAAVMSFLWLVLKPAFLYPRFFLVLVPACAYLMAAAIARWKVLAPVVALGAVTAVAGQLALYTDNQLALPQAAAFIDRIHAEGGRACVIHSDEQVVAAYTTNYVVVTRPDQLSGCDAVVVVSWNVDLPLRDLAAKEFPKTTVLPAEYPTVILER